MINTTFSLSIGLRMILFSLTNCNAFMSPQVCCWLAFQVADRSLFDTRVKVDTDTKTGNGHIDPDSIYLDDKTFVSNDSILADGMNLDGETLVDSNSDAANEHSDMDNDTDSDLDDEYDDVDYDSVTDD